MNKAIEAARLPYIMLCTALVACGLFFGTQLWQEGGGQKIRDGLLYAPGFVVKAEVVDVMEALMDTYKTLRTGNETFIVQFVLGN